MKTSEKIIRNTLYNSAGYAWGVLAGLALTPYIIFKLGIEKFGLWVLVAVVVDYFALLDISGIGDSFVKYISEYYAKKDYQKINQIISFGTLYYFIFTLGAAILAFIFKHQLFSLFKFPPHSQGEVDFVFFGVIAILGIRMTLAVFRSVLFGLQRMDLTNIALVLTSIVNILGTIFWLSLGFGLKGLVINGITCALVFSATQIVCAYRILPQIRFRLFNFERALFFKSFNYGIKLHIATIAYLVNDNVDKLLIGHFLSLSLVGLYELGFKIAKMVSFFSTQAFLPLLPASSELDALKDKDRLIKLYRQGTKYLIASTFPMAFFMIFNASLIMLFWMGKSGFENSVLTLRFLSLASIFSVLITVAIAIARGIGIPKYEMFSSLIVVVLNIVLSITLILKLGFIGTLIGTVTSTVIGAFYFMMSFHSFIREKIALTVKKIYTIPILACGLASLCIWAIDILFLRLNFVSGGRFTAFLALAIKADIFFGVYILTILKLGYIDRFDFDIFSRAAVAAKTLFRLDYYA